ncbi:hypothetical protein JHK82_051024 [Glycine max]|nr:hypothetical protein JHK82_051024 [Glycine max]
MVQGQLHSAVDERLKAKGGYIIEEGERLLHLGLLCSHTDPSIRPTMRQVVKILEVEIDSIESDEDNMEMSLLGKIRSATTWSRAECALPYSGYPSFDEVKMFSFNSRTTRSGSSTFPGSESEITKKEGSTSVELAFLRQWTHVFKANVVVEGGCFYIDRKRTVLETRDKRSRAYSSTDVESTCSTTVILQTM